MSDQFDVTPEAIAKRRAEGQDPEKKKDEFTLEVKIQFVFLLVAIAAFFFSIWACSFLFKVGTVLIL